MGYRYIGSKEKLSEVIISEIRFIKKDARHIIDLMAGTGLFSLALRENGFDVTAVDVMTYSYHHLNVQLRLNTPPQYQGVFPIKGIANFEDTMLFKPTNYELVLNYLNQLPPVKGYFWQEFSPEGSPHNSSKPRQYFSANNAAKIDAIRLKIRELREEKAITDIEHSLIIHDLIMATNDIANIAGTYGHYLSKFVTRALTPIELRPSSFSNKGSIEGHTIFRGYAEELALILRGDICYIDPPYIKRQYAANYHILETLAREDEPEAIGESGLRPWRDQYSDFCSKVRIRKSFDKIFKNVQCSDFLISYSEDGLIPIDDLLSFFSNYGEVSKKDIEYKRFKSNNNMSHPTLTEYLIHLHLK